MILSITALGFFSNWVGAWCDSIAGIVLVAVGMALIVAEMFMPGFGFAGISGGIAVTIGLILGSDTLAGAMFSLLIIILVLVTFAVIIFRSVLKGRLSRSPVVLNTAIEADSTELSSGRADELLGKRGVAHTALRPSGIVLVEGERLDVVADNEFVDRGAEVVVTGIDGTRIIVKRI